jgi:uncharacterized membrane protein
MDSPKKQAAVQPANAKDTEKDLRSVAGTNEEKSGTQRAKFMGEDRLLVLCDGIFAIATTLLVIDIKLPSGISNVGDFNNALLNLLSNSVVFYLITFTVIASLWIEHRQMMHYIRYQDARFTWLTLLFLVFVAFFPVTSNVLESYSYPGAVILYTLTFSGCGLSLVLVWLYASWHHRLIAPDLPLERIISFAVSLALTPVYFALSLLLLFFPIRPTTVFWSWLLLPFFALAFRLVSRKELSSSLSKFLSHELEER